jgi:hypothetical protein
VIVFSDSPCERIGELETFPILKENNINARLAGASVTKTAISLGSSRATVSKLMSAYTDHEKTISAKRNSEQNSTLAERDRRTVGRILSKNHRTTAAEVTGQQN